MSDSKEQALESKLSNIFGLICVVLFILGPLKPEVEEEVAEHQFFFSLVHLSPPLFSPQEPNAVRRASPNESPETPFLRSKF